MRHISTTAALTVAVVLLGASNVTRAEDSGLCGFASHEVELSRLGDGDSDRGAVIYNQRQLEQDEKQLAPDDPRIIFDMEGLVRMFERVGEHAHAEQLARKAVERAKTSKLEAPLSSSLYGLGSYFLARHDFAVAELALARAVLAARPNTSDGYMSLELHAEALLGLGRAAEAEADYRKALAAFRAQPPNPEDQSGADIQREIARACSAQNHFDAAEHALSLAEEEMIRVRGEDHWNSAETLDEHAQVLRRLGHKKEAIALERRALKIFRQNAQNPNFDSKVRKSFLDNIADIESRD
jgi:tetratricopeptide (TPR) repeat protein